MYRDKIAYYNQLQESISFLSDKLAAYLKTSAKGLRRAINKQTQGGLQAKAKGMPFAQASYPANYNSFLERNSRILGVNGSDVIKNIKAMGLTPEQAVAQYSRAGEAPAAALTRLGQYFKAAS